MLQSLFSFLKAQTETKHVPKDYLSHKEKNERYLSLLKKTRNIDFKIRMIVDHVFAGEYRSRFRGSGMEFDEVKEYVPGDDIKTIDWNVTARMNRPFVKRYHEERELVLMLVIDGSASGYFGSGERSKNDLAIEVASILALSAIKNRDKVGFLIFTDKVEFFLPPTKGKDDVLRIIREFISFRPKSTQTDLRPTLQALSRILKKRSLIFLLSDFLYPIHYQKQLHQLAYKHKLTAIRIVDPKELCFPKIGLTEIEDFESRKRRVVDSNSRSFQEEYKKAATEHGQKLQILFRKLQIPYYPLLIKEDYLTDLILYFKYSQFP